MPLENASALLRREVVFRDIRLGAVVDVVFDPGLTRAIGFDVRCGDGVHRFLPFAAAAIGPESLDVSSPLVLMDRSLYSRRTHPLGDLRGQAVREGGRTVGELSDLALADDGALAAFVVLVDGQTVEVGPEAEIGGERLEPAV